MIEFLKMQNADIKNLVSHLASKSIGINTYKNNAIKNMASLAWYYPKETFLFDNSTGRVIAIIQAPMMVGISGFVGFLIPLPLL